MKLQNNITRENVKSLMHLFYTRAMQDRVLGPFFINELGSDIKSQDWQEHIELLADFWLAELKGEKTYKGNIYGAHIKVPHISRKSFAKWIELFSMSVDEIYIASVADNFKQKGIDLSKDFIAHLNI